MNPYPRRVVVTTTYNSKQQVWHAMLDDNRDLIGMGQQETDAVYDLFCQITEREADENDQDRWEHETRGRRDPDPDVARERQRDDKMWDEES